MSDLVEIKKGLPSALKTHAGAGVREYVGRMNRLEAGKGTTRDIYARSLERANRSGRQAQKMPAEWRGSGVKTGQEEKNAARVSLDQSQARGFTAKRNRDAAFNTDSFGPGRSERRKKILRARP
jgi:hypothetical protein